MNHFKLVILAILLSISTTIFAFQSNAADINYRNTVAHFYNLQSTKNLTLLKVKGYQQVEGYTCGPAAVMSLMHYYGMLKDEQMNHATELKIAKEMGSSEKVGTSPKQITMWLQQHGFAVHSGEGGTLAMLQENLKKGIPTIVEWADWGAHWVVVTGYDAAGNSPSDEEDTIFFADPSAHFDNIKYMDGITTINPDRFSFMWFDVLFTPGHLTKGIYVVAVPKMHG